MRRMSVHEGRGRLRSERAARLRRCGGRAGLERARILGEIGEGAWPGEIKALHEVHPDALELLEHRRGFDAFRDRMNAESTADLAHRLHHAAIDGIVRNLTDELAVDLQEVH